VRIALRGFGASFHAAIDQSEGGLRGHLAEFGFVEAQDLHKVARLGVLRDYFEETHVPTSLIFGPQVTSPLSTL
jgi:hypothetical protein